MTSLLAYVLVLFQKLKPKVRVRSGGSVGLGELWTSHEEDEYPETSRGPFQPGMLRRELACLEET